MQTLSLTKEEVELLIYVSDFDLYIEHSGGADSDWKVCPICGSFSEDPIYIYNILSAQEFEELVKLDPAKPDQHETEDIFNTYLEYNKFYYEKIKELYGDRIKHPHEEGCRIEELKTLGEKIKDFLEQQ